MPNLLLQGPLDQPENRSRLLDYLEAGLTNPKFEKLKIMVAYAKEAPLKKLVSTIESWKSEGKRIDAVLGIDQQGTSLDALSTASDLFDSVRIFHQAGFTHTFHPKLYFFQGEEESSAYIGSNNLTTGGTETNFECGVQIDLQTSEDADFIKRVEEVWRETCDYTLELDGELLSNLEEADLVVSEDKAIKEPGKKYDAVSRGRNQASIPEFPRVDIQSARASPRKGKQDGDSHSTRTSAADQAGFDQIEDAVLLEWRKRNLKSRDAQRPSVNTNPSGVITLVQDYFEDDEGNRIDKTTYFRYDVFGELNWWEEDGKEITNSQFRVWIGGTYLDTFTLRISHKIEWESGQDNYTTAIHWDDLNAVLRNDVDIRGWNFYLYKTETKGLWEIQLVPPEDTEG